MVSRFGSFAEMGIALSKLLPPAPGFNFSRCVICEKAYLSQIPTIGNWLYLLYCDCAGWELKDRIVYVGKTNNAKRRIKEHALSKKDFDLVFLWESVEDVSFAETKTIRQYKPIHNVLDNPRNSKASVFGYSNKKIINGTVACPLTMNFSDCYNCEECIFFERWGRYQGFQSIHCNYNKSN